MNEKSTNGKPARAAETTSDALAIQSIWDSVKIAALGAIRTAPLWLLAGLVAFIASGRLAQSGTDDPSARAELGLTDQVVWPFFEVVLSETEARALDVEPRLRSEFGDSLLTYEVDRPDNIGLVEIRTTATTEADALAAVNAAADAVLAADLALSTSRVTDEIEALQRAEQAATADLESVLDRIAATTAEFVPNLLEAERRQLDQNLQNLQAERDSLSRSRLSAQEQLRALTVELDTTTSQIELSNITSLAEPDTSTTGLQLAAAIGVGLAAALALNVLVREQGRIMNPAHVRSVIGLPALRFPETPTTAVALARLLYSLREESGTRMIGVAAIPTGADSAHEMSLGLKSIGEDVLVTEFGFESDRGGSSLAFSILDPFDATTIDAQMACDVAIVVVWERNTRLWDLRRKIQQLEDRGLPVRGVLLRREK